MAALPSRPLLLRGLAWAWLGGLVLAALWAWQTGSAQPAATQLDLSQLSLPPSARHWLGTDPFGRDVLAVLLAGTRNLLAVSLPAALVATALGASLGAAAGYWGNRGLRVRRAAVVVIMFSVVGALVTGPQLLPRWLLAGALGATAAHYLPLRATWPLPLDRLVLAAGAFTASVPRLVLALLLAALHAPSKPWLLAVLAGTCWPPTARLSRTLVAQLRRQPYIEAGRAAGFSDWRILWRHLLPNAKPALRASLPLNLTVCFGLQTTLSFLGIGLPPDELDWGRTLADARLEPSAWWLTVGGLFFLTCTMAALHLLSATDSRNGTPHSTLKTADQRVTNKD
ncbi:ABC transporter permease [Hymenobacter gummosus]|uniref:ABC transporter permease n=1 Tax=Hymenobacter gummosus TaxID=1776032 RepID=A0A431U1V3_9BACT|nr:ABC transporter permease subunit [Hymenobacter gummosus]RTQ49165.1 ABC transporter permease [Hymenobacter gummosus]